MDGTTVACDYCTVVVDRLEPDWLSLRIGIGVGFGINMKYGLLLKDDGTTVARTD